MSVEEHCSLQADYKEHGCALFSLFCKYYFLFILINTSNIWTVIKLYSCYLHMYFLQCQCHCFFCCILDGVLCQHCLSWVYNVVFKLPVCNLIAVILLIVFREVNCHIFTFQRLHFIGTYVIHTNSAARNNHFHHQEYVLYQ